MTAVATRPAYRQPWNHGAKSYPEADSLDAMWIGIKGKRKPLTVHVAHAGLTGRVCAGCGVAFDAPYPINAGTSMETMVEDRGGYAYVDVDPKKGTAVARHYYCAWGSLMAEVLRIHTIQRGG